MATRCDRCSKETLATMVSMFNLDEICLDCKDLERSHPLYREATRIEADACQAGDYNFPGIGRPVDL